jgi:hypothetical protein
VFKVIVEAPTFTIDDVTEINEAVPKTFRLPVISSEPVTCTVDPEANIRLERFESSVPLPNMNAPTPGTAKLY